MKFFIQESRKSEFDPRLEQKSLLFAGKPSVSLQAL